MVSFDAFSMDDDDLHTPNSHFDQDDVVVESYAGYGSYTDRPAAIPASPDISRFKDPSPTRQWAALHRNCLRKKTTMAAAITLHGREQEGHDEIFTAPGRSGGYQRLGNSWKGSKKEREDHVLQLQPTSTMAVRTMQMGIRQIVPAKLLKKITVQELGPLNPDSQQQK
ncbi:hypothetical protein ACFX11_033319 [Malus domestica]